MNLFQIFISLDCFNIIILHSIHIFVWGYHMMYLITWLNLIWSYENLSLIKSWIIHQSISLYFILLMSYEILHMDIWFSLINTYTPPLSFKFNYLCDLQTCLLCQTLFTLKLRSLWSLLVYPCYSISPINNGMISTIENI